MPLKFRLCHTYDLRVQQKGQAVWRRKSTPVFFFMSARASWRGLRKQAERGSRLGHHDRVRIVDGEAKFLFCGGGKGGLRDLYCDAEVVGQHGTHRAPRAYPRSALHDWQHRPVLDVIDRRDLPRKGHVRLRHCYAEVNAPIVDFDIVPTSQQGVSYETKLPDPLDRPVTQDVPLLIDFRNGVLSVEQNSLTTSMGVESLSQCRSR